jgi:hypothetical protein
MKNTFVKYMNSFDCRERAWRISRPWIADNPVEDAREITRISYSFVVRNCGSLAVLMYGICTDHLYGFGRFKALVHI